MKRLSWLRSATLLPLIALLTACAALLRQPALALSGSGLAGGFRAGSLNGWTAKSDRPKYVLASAGELNEEEMNKEYGLGYECGSEDVPWQRLSPGYRP